MFVDCLEILNKSPIFVYTFKKMLIQMKLSKFTKKSAR